MDPEVIDFALLYSTIPSPNLNRQAKYYQSTNKNIVG